MKLDKLGNIYSISSSQELVKYDHNAKAICNYRERFLGQARLLDVSNPLKILVFYPEVLTVVELDNMLDVKRRINLEELGLSENSLICRSFDNNFWLFNERAFRLEKYAEDLKLSVQGEWLRDVIDREDLPLLMKEHERKIYLVYEEGLEVFDLFGSHLNTLHFDGVTDLEFFQSSMIMLRMGNLEQYNFETLRHSTILSNLNEAKSLSVGSTLLYIWDGKKIRAYELPK